MNIQQNPALYLSLPHPCSYLPKQVATTLFIDPQFPVNSELHGLLARQGFRRSGDLVYRPHCQNCSACVSVRVPVAEFIPSRGQKRTWKKNQDISVSAKAAVFNQEHYDLFLRYQEKRHPGSGMGNPDPERYMRFLVCRTVKTVFYELRKKEALLGVAVVDLLPDGLSAVYTFYDPDLPERGLGVYSILWQIAHTRDLGLSWLYLGYWIKESPKMAYKINYQPLQIYQNGLWRAPILAIP